MDAGGIDRYQEYVTEATRSEREGVQRASSRGHLGSRKSSDFGVTQPWARSQHCHMLALRLGSALKPFWALVSSSLKRRCEYCRPRGVGAEMKPVHPSLRLDVGVI